MAGDKADGGEVPLLYSEGNIAARVALEREVRGWSTIELADRVSKAGVKMNQTAVWRIENGTPRRRINVDEALAFARVFELPLEELMSPSDPEPGPCPRCGADIQLGLEALWD